MQVASRLPCVRASGLGSRGTWVCRSWSWRGWRSRDIRSVCPGRCRRGRSCTCHSRYCSPYCTSRSSYRSLRNEPCTRMGNLHNRNIRSRTDAYCQHVLKLTRRWSRTNAYLSWVPAARPQPWERRQGGGGRWQQEAWWTPWMQLFRNITELLPSHVSLQMLEVCSLGSWLASLYIQSKWRNCQRKYIAGN
jgi:hypothetical protein